MATSTTPLAMVRRGQDDQGAQDAQEFAHRLWSPWPRRNASLASDGGVERRAPVIPARLSGCILRAHKGREARTTDQELGRPRPYPAPPAPDQETRLVAIAEPATGSPLAEARRL